MTLSKFGYQIPAKPTKRIVRVSYLLFLVQRLPSVDLWEARSAVGQYSAHISLRAPHRRSDSGERVPVLGLVVFSFQSTQFLAQSANALASLRITASSSMLISWSFVGLLNKVLCSTRREHISLLISCIRRWFTTGMMPFTRQKVWSILTTTSRYRGQWSRSTD